MQKVEESLGRKSEAEGLAVWDGMAQGSFRLGSAWR
ncbi:hypothetical protein IMSAGC005_02660 [Lachnospiraceae bacterium]|nr:hypothetical protein IMSAGC005_02660 [Lachnospiraceae bacterium]